MGMQVGIGTTPGNRSLERGRGAVILAGAMTIASGATASWIVTVEEKERMGSMGHSRRTAEAIPLFLHSASGKLSFGRF
jgi:hypothetical protein